MRRAKGFTLIELLITVLVLGVLIAIAVPRFTSTKENAFESSAKTDLRNAMSAQEGYFSENDIYATDLSQLELTTSTGVLLGGGGSASGYRMTAKHAASPTTFTVEVGSGATTDGIIR